MQAQGSFAPGFLPITLLGGACHDKKLQRKFKIVRLPELTPNGW
jgi:hypothetical protein